MNTEESIINRSEIRRLEKAVKDKNKLKILEWLHQFEIQISNREKNKYDKRFDDEIEIIYLTIVYTLHYNEKTNFGLKRINDFMIDLLQTIDMFRTGEATPDDYRKQLLNDGIILGDNEK